MKYCVYQFEAVSIQEYILASGKMKSMVGASELLEAITNQLLDITISKMGLETHETKSFNESKELNLNEHQVIFPRRAGGVFIAVLTNERKAHELAKIWPILVSGFAPGLKFSASLKTGESYNEVSKNVRSELNDQKNLPQTQLPETTPITVRFAKTGMAQVQAPSKHSDGLDWTMKAKNENIFDTLASKHLHDELLKKQSEIGHSFCFPKVIDHTATPEKSPDAFPFTSNDPGRHSVAIIHTDGNGLGGYLHKIFHNLNEQSANKSIQAYADFSLGLDVATQNAAKVATKWLVNTFMHDEKLNLEASNIYLPMRPLILGGDDLTCIVRADYALGFVKTFTESFESETASFVKKIKQDYPDIYKQLPDTLTCTSGVLFLKSNQPFSQGYALAEELCASAKSKGRKLNSDMPPSLVSFLHTTNTLFDELDVQIEQELKTPKGQWLSCMPYAFNSFDSRTPSLNMLFSLSETFSAIDDSKLNPSTMRAYAGHIYKDEHYAQVFWERWKKRSKDDRRVEESWNHFEEIWSELANEGVLPVADLISVLKLEMQNPYIDLQGAQL